MQKDKDLFRLEHMIDSIKKIMELVKILENLENFETKWIEQDSLIRNFEIIGEASNHISEETKQRYPNIEWKELKGMRNYITHEYFGVDLANIWNTAINDIHRLKNQINQIISEIQAK